MLRNEITKCEGFSIFLGLLWPIDFLKDAPIRAAAGPHQSLCLPCVAPSGVPASVVPLLISSQGIIVAFVTVFQLIIILTLWADFPRATT